MNSILLFVCSFLTLSQSKQYNFSNVNTLLDSVDSKFQSEFESIDFKELSPDDLGQYTCLYGKAHLYGMLSTPSSILHGFAFIKLAAEEFQVPACMHILGIMYNFKMTPHFNIEETVVNNSVLDQYIKKSHLKNSEMFLYLASLKQYTPSAMIMGNLNHIGLSTKLNCTTAAMYYRLIIEKVFIQEYQKHGYYRDRSSASFFQEQLYLKQELVFQDEASDSYIVEQSLNFGQESYSANFILAQNYYYGRNGFLRNVIKAAQMFEKLKDVGNLQSASLLGLCYFKGEGVRKNYKTAYELFKASKNVDLSKYMLDVMQYFGIHIKTSKQTVLKRLKDEVRQNYHAKGLYGALILRGEVPSEQKQTGMVLLQQSSNNGFSVSKLILGLAYLDGIQIPYSCSKGITLIRQGLLSVDLWADKSEEAKIAIKNGKYMFALIKYLQLSLTGSSVGLVNGLYILQMYMKELKSENWDSDLISADPLFQHIQLLIPDLSAEQMLFGDIYQVALKEDVSAALHNTTKNYLHYIKTKMLTICKNGGVTICMFLSYKQNPTNKGLLKDLAKRQGEKLHLLEARFLLGQHYQKSNETLEAIKQYSRATSSLIVPIVMIIEGYRFSFSILDDLMVLLTLVVIGVAVSVIHRNMIQLKRHKEQRQKQREEEERIEREQQNIMEERMRKLQEQTLVESEENHLKEE